MAVTTITRVKGDKPYAMFGHRNRFFLCFLVIALKFYDSFITSDSALSDSQNVISFPISKCLTKLVLIGFNHCFGTNDSIEIKGYTHLNSFSLMNIFYKILY